MEVHSFSLLVEITLPIHVIIRCNPQVGSHWQAYADQTFCLSELVRLAEAAYCFQKQSFPYHHDGLKHLRLMSKMKEKKCDIFKVYHK